MSSETDFKYEGGDNLDAMEFAKNYNAYLLGLIDRHVPGQRLLDFGAGIGTFALPIAAHGRNVVCVEPDSKQRAVTTGTLETHADLSSIPNGSIDGAYSLNVLEHIEHEERPLSALIQRLRPGGRFLVYVPAFNVLFSSMDRRVGHFRRYRRFELESLLHRCGFEIVLSRYVDGLGFFVTLLYKVIGSRSGNVSPRSVSIYDRFVFPASLLCDRLFGRVLGKNVLVVAKKPE
jgi:SAM-dependent methyltransferase